MSESRGAGPFYFAVLLILVVGGGWYFSQHYEIAGLDSIHVTPKQADAIDDDFSDQETFAHVVMPADIPAQQLARASEPQQVSDNPFARLASRSSKSPVTTPPAPRRYRPLRIATWALDGFGPTKLANPLVQKNTVRVIRRFDLVALQQIVSIERDLIPRLVEVINQGDRRYDCVVGPTTGPDGRQEQLAFIFDTTRVLVDRSQTYTVDDPEDQVTFDPLVAWFRAAEPPTALAWTFSLANIRVELTNAPKEVGLLPEMLTSIAHDGRGEDDILLAGLFQADDAYLIPTMGARRTIAAIRNRSTDIFGRYQSSNLLIDADDTTEYMGRGGVDDFVRLYGLNLAQAGAVTSHLPVYAEFSPIEGGQDLP